MRLQVDLNYSSLPTQIVHTRPRLGGVLSMGCHGKGIDFGAVADFVHSIKIVQGSGEVVEYDASHPRFNEARCVWQASIRHWLSAPVSWAQAATLTCMAAGAGRTSA
jgi:hypothetical protein